MRIKSIVLGLTQGLILACAAASVQAQDAQPPKWGASIDFEGKAGNKRALGEADAFVPFAQDDQTLLFGNARFRFDDERSKEGNFGLGLRHMLGEWNLGTYGYYDRRETGNENMFNQATFGIEALGTDFDLRANSYWPFGDTTKNADALSTATLSGTAVTFRGGEERAFRGFDAEAGWRVPVFEFESPYDFRVYGGGYHFYDPDDVAPSVTGPRLRAELTAYELYYFPKGSRVTFGAEFQDDDVRGRQGFASVRLRMPLQSDAQRNRQLTAQERRMTTPIVRDIDIVAQAGAFGPAETATQLANGSTFTVFNSASTTGAALPGAISGAGSTVLLSGTFNTTAATTMNAGQTVIGANFATVRSPSGRTAPLTATGGTISANVADGGFVLAANTTVNGMTITNTRAGQAFAVEGAGLATGSVTLTNNVFSTTTTGGTAVGLRINSNNTVTLTLSGNTITTSTVAGQTGNAIILDGGTIIATVNGNTIGATGGTTNRVLAYDQSIFSNSTNNTYGGGVCQNGGGVTGSVSFTNGTVCQ